MKMKRGQSIVETVIAAALISIAIIAALSLANYSQKQTNYAKSLAESTKYNVQVADWLRKEKNELGFATLADKVASDATNNLVTYCLNEIPSDQGGDFTTMTAGTCDASSYVEATVFQRHISIDASNVASGILKITITTTWQENTIRTASIEMELSPWQ